MDNSDLPLIVAELLIDMQHLKERVALLEGTFREVRDDLHDIHSGVRDMHAGYQEQSDRLGSVLEKITALVRERDAGGGARSPAGSDGPADQPAGPENPVS